METLSREAFFALPIGEIETLTGLEAPTEDETDYRERAWRNYKQDVTNEEEWGGIEGDGPPVDGA